jgi:hypothetical protein
MHKKGLISDSSLAWPQLLLLCYHNSQHLLFLLSCNIHQN